MENEELVRVLSGARHDWLNQLQLIKAHLALNRTEQAEAVIEDIIVTAQNEAKISQLNAPDFASFFLTFNWYPHSYHLDFEVTGGRQTLASLDQVLVQLAADITGLFDEYAGSMIQNHVRVMMHLSDDEIQITFDYSGSINCEQQLHTAIRDLNMKPYMTLVQNEVTPYEAVATIRLDIKELNGG